MQIYYLLGIVKSPTIFAEKRFFFNKNKKPSQLFLKLTIVFQILLYNNRTFLGSLIAHQDQA